MSDNKNLLATMGGGASLKDAEQMAKALQGSSQDTARASLPDGGVYISYSGKKQRYSIGENSDDSDPEEIWLLNIMSVEAGFICWKSNKVMKRVHGSIYQPPVAQPDFEEFAPFNKKSGEGWYKLKLFMLRSLDSGVQGQFSTNTQSALAEVSKLEKMISERTVEGKANWPIIQLQQETFEGQGQTNGKPVFKVFGWLGTKQVVALADMTIEEIQKQLDPLLDEAEVDPHLSAEELSALEGESSGEEDQAASEEQTTTEPEPEPEPEAKSEPETTQEEDAELPKRTRRRSRTEEAAPRRRARV